MFVDREVLMEIFSRAGIDFFIEYTHEGEILVVSDRYNGFRCKMTFDGEGKLISLDDYGY